MNIFLWLLLLFSINRMQAQNTELVGIELAKAPSDLKNASAYNFGTKLTFFASDTSVITGLTTSYKIKKWITDTGKDLKQEHNELAKIAIEKDYRVARDTSILSKRGFWQEHRKGFTFKLHNWGLPDSSTTSMTVKAEIKYTVLTTDEVAKEDITHLAGNFSFDTMSLDFMGNTINLKKKVYGKGEEAYTTFNGTMTNKAYLVAIKTMQFLNSEGKVMDELYFGLNNNYNTSTRNRVDLRNVTVVRMHYRKLKIKKVKINSTFGLGFD